MLETGFAIKSPSATTIILVFLLLSIKFKEFSFGIILSLNTDVKLPDNKTDIGIFGLLNVSFGGGFSKIDKLILDGDSTFLDLTDEANSIVFLILFFIVSIELTKSHLIASIFLLIGLFDEFFNSG